MHCRNPLVSFVYERGWRQGFKSAGFPGQSCQMQKTTVSVRLMLLRIVCSFCSAGADEELKLSMDFLRPAFNEVRAYLRCTVFVHQQLLLEDVKPVLISRLLVLASCTLTNRQWQCFCGAYYCDACCPIHCGYINVHVCCRSC